MRTEQLNFFNWLSNVKNLVLSNRALREGEQEGTMTPGPMDFRRPMGLKGPMTGPNGIHRKWTWKWTFFYFWDHLNLDRKTVLISVKTFFFEITCFRPEKPFSWHVLDCTKPEMRNIWVVPGPTLGSRCPYFQMALNTCEMHRWAQVR